MNYVEISAVFSTLITISALYAFVGRRFLLKLRDEVRAQWDLTRTSLEKRQSLIPNLVETVRLFEKNKEKTALLLKNLIEKRSELVRIYYPNTLKIQKEIELGTFLNDVLNLAFENRELASDTNFLELRKEIDDLEKNINERSALYNEMAKTYNAKISKWYLAPIAGLFKFHRANHFSLNK